VLVEGDDFNEPIPDAVKGITDGHLWLNRALANRGHYPAIDVIQSISRVRGDVTDKDHLKQAVRVLALHAVYEEIADLVNIGAYVPGANPEYDLAVQSRAKILAYLQQGAKDPCTFEQSRKQLADLVNWIDQAEKVLKTQAASKGAAKR
jgi:flagellum-specific ATP synthase